MSKNSAAVNRQPEDRDVAGVTVEEIADREARDLETLRRADETKFTDTRTHLASAVEAGVASDIGSKGKEQLGPRIAETEEIVHEKQMWENAKEVASAGGGYSLTGRDLL
ncbi:hypothetical protein HDU93_009983 [Gonapodya sp. JEL0774]|nr:hypothetical protein HDU93_009983 [Gonapodya sp. JEL0774]